MARPNLSLRTRLYATLANQYNYVLSSSCLDQETTGIGKSGRWDDRTLRRFRSSMELMSIATDAKGAPERASCEPYSCARCRKLKKRCSKEAPVCVNCLKAGERCVYPGRAPRRSKRELEMERNRATSVSSGELVTKRSRVSYDQQSLATPKDELVRSSSYAEALPESTAESGPPSRPPSVLSMLHSAVEPAATLAGDSPPKQFHQDGLLLHEMHQKESVPIRASSLQIENVAAVFKGGRHSSVVQSDGTTKHFERPLYDRFIAAYFKHNHRSYPVLNKIEFLNRVSKIRDFDEMEGNFEDTFIFEVYMVMAIGCTTLQRAGILHNDEQDLSEHFSYLAMKKFCPVMHLQNVETITCLLLLGIYSFFEPQGVSSWTISGIVMRLTIGLGLHRALTTRKIQYMSLIDVEMRYRAFWSFYSFERLVSTSLGRISAIDDDDISVPLPHALFAEEAEDIEVTKMMIALRRIGGIIYKRVHSVAAGKQKLSASGKQEVIDDLRNQIDALYEKERAKIREANTLPSNSKGNSCISFHTSDIWLAMRYAQLQIMLYRPSALIPKPPIESLSILGDFCLQALKHTYSLYKKKLQPLNWITLLRTLTICNTMLYCLCQWSIDLIECKIEIQQCVEILQHFGEKWVFAAKCADVFQTISNAILDISLSNGQVPNMDNLTRELFGASNEYQDILDENNVDISWVDDIV
ncbi:LADA_0F01552g1_1 [Lachancea dasiensis]|uniref:LADA_0F01552g1_1 n=1 Tax=Lachancea dasiensis TaxID=1072105 RepID=A0A1G4JI92_9SACH|nr:LADA_0F01552g1_1 [Lachancea dasiensis]